MIDDTQSQKTDDRATSWWIVGPLISVAIVVWLASPWIASKLLHHFVQRTELEEIGLVGDSFGTVNALFTGLALLFAGWALIYQQKELKQTTRALEAQEEELHNQVHAVNRQLFETTFYNLLRLHHDSISQVRASRPLHGHKTDPLAGHQAFRYRTQLLVDALKSAGPKEHEERADPLAPKSFLRDLERIRRVIRHHDPLKHPGMTAYFGSHFGLLRYIAGAHSIDNRMFYANLLRDMMRQHELVYLHYLVVAYPEAYPDALKHVEKFHMCSTLIPRRLAFDWHIFLREAAMHDTSVEIGLNIQRD